MAFEQGRQVGLSELFFKANKVNGVEAVVSGSFLTGSPEQPYPEPGGDIYLNKIATRVAGHGDVVISTRLLDGEKDYLRRIHLLPETAKIIEVTPKIADLQKPGYPVTDPFALLAGEVEVVNGAASKVAVTVFENSYTSEIARALGMRTLERTPSTLTNDKALFREKATEYGIDQVEGDTVGDWEEFFTAVEKYRGKKVWMKEAGGSGGDFVIPVEGLDITGAIKALGKMRDSFWIALERGTFDKSGREMWPADEVTPHGRRIVIEEDVAENGNKLLLNGSNHFVVDNNGNVDILNYFEQVTSEKGAYIGSKPAKLDSDVKRVLDEQTRRVGQMCKGEFKFAGPGGIDYFVYQTPDGEVKAVVSEFNARQIISTYPDLIVHNLRQVDSGYSGDDLYWENINLKSDTPFERSIDEYVNKVGEGYAYGIRRDGIVVAQVIPQAFRTEFYRSQQLGEGVIADGGFKALILARGEDGCSRVRHSLQERGIEALS